MVPIVDSTILGLISSTPPTFIPPFEPPEFRREGCHRVAKAGHASTTLGDILSCCRKIKAAGDSDGPGRKVARHGAQ